MMSDTPQKHDGDNRDDEDDEDEDDQPQDQYLNNPQCTVSCWIKLLVKHLMAKHRLETHCHRLHTHGIKSAFEINILRVDKIEDDLSSWEEVTSIITSVIQKYFPFNNFPSSDTDLQMINWLLQYINETLQTPLRVLHLYVKKLQSHIPGFPGYFGWDKVPTFLH